MLTFCSVFSKILLFKKFYNKKKKKYDGFNISYNWLIVILVLYSQILWNFFYGKKFLCNFLISKSKLFVWFLHYSHENFILFQKFTKWFFVITIGFFAILNFYISHISDSLIRLEFLNFNFNDIHSWKNWELIT